MLKAAALLGRARVFCASRIVRIASLRSSRDIRSRIRMPSRWSISCWITRASRPDASTRSSSPCSSGRGRARATGRSTSTCTPGRLRQPSSAGSRSSLDHSSRGLTSGVSGILGIGAIDEHAVQNAQLGRRQPDAERVVHELTHPLDLRRAAHRRRRSIRAPWRAARGRRACGRGASAASRRARVSGSSGGGPASTSPTSSATSGDCCTSAMAPF